MSDAPKHLRRRDPRKPFSRKHAVLALAAVALIAAVPRFYHLSNPPDRVFDETYYSKDACLYTGIPWQRCGLKGDFEQSWVHPPLGKWMIAAGIEVFGNKPFGWRVSSAVFGTATVVLTALIALILFRSVLLSFVAGLLLATENLEFVQSRTSMLDIFLAFWVVLGFLFVILDRRYIQRRTEEQRTAPLRPELSPGPGAMAVDEPAAAAETLPAPIEVRPRPPAPIWRPWRLAAGVAFGAACAVKWDGLWALFGAGVLLLAWETARRIGTTRHPFWKTVQQEGFTLVLFLLVVPILVYMASYIGFFVQNGFHLGLFWDRQTGMYHFHTTLHAFDPVTHKPSHPYMSPPWTWLYMGRPVSYYFKNPSWWAEIIGIGNPVIFWSAILTVPYVAYRGWTRRDWRAWFIVGAFLFQYLPWFAFSSRVQFMFYMTPMTPFMVLAAAYMLRDIAPIRIFGSTLRPLRPVAIGFVIAAVGMFIYWYPLLVGWHMSEAAWRARMWFSGWV